MPTNFPATPPALPDPAGLVGLLYASVAHTDMDAPRWAALVAASQIRNAASGITGALLVHTSLVVQWLEGPASQIELLWESLCKDERHHSVAKLWSASLPQGRIFEAWHMVRVDASRTDVAALIQAALQPKHRAQCGGSRSSDNPQTHDELSAGPIFSLLLDQQFGFTYRKHLR